MLALIGAGLKGRCQVTTRGVAVSDVENQSQIHKLNERTLWVRGVVGIGAIVTCIWILYHAFKTDGLLATLIGAVFLIVVSRIGVAPLFAAVTTLLCFYFHTVGWWLPAISYILAGFLLYLDLKLDATKRKG